MSSQRQLPWESWDEWCAVHQNIYSGSREKIDRALSEIEIWRLRGRLPHAIESTACLTEALLVDWSTLNSVTDVVPRQTLALAIARFVDGLADAGQHGTRAVSVGLVAARIGLPRRFVDLRHTTVHGRLPPLRTLATAAVEALGWIEQRYWAKQRLMLNQTASKAADLAVNLLLDAAESRKPRRGNLLPREIVTELAPAVAALLRADAIEELPPVGLKALLTAAKTPAMAALPTAVAASLIAGGDAALAGQLAQLGQVRVEQLRKPARQAMHGASAETSRVLKRIVRASPAPAPVVQIGCWAVRAPMPADAPADTLPPLGGRPAVPAPQLPPGSQARAGAARAHVNWYQ